MLEDLEIALDEGNNGKLNIVSNRSINFPRLSFATMDA